MRSVVLHRAGPLRPPVERDKFVKVLFEPLEHPPVASVVPTAAAQPPDGYFARHAVAHVVRPAPQTQQNGELATVQVDVDIEPLVHLGIEQPLVGQLVHRSLLHFVGPESRVRPLFEVDPDAHAVAPRVELAKFGVAHEELAAGTRFGRGQGGKQDDQGGGNEGQARGSHRQAFLPKGPGQGGGTPAPEWRKTGAPGISAPDAPGLSTRDRRAVPTHGGEETSVPGASAPRLVGVGLVA